jgi:hypothetical protein
MSYYFDDNTDISDVLLYNTRDAQCCEWTIAVRYCSRVGGAAAVLWYRGLHAGCQAELMPRTAPLLRTSWCACLQAQGALIGGSMGDLMAKKMPNNGRILTAQISVFCGA